MGLGCSSALWGAPQALSALVRGLLLKTLPVTMKGTLLCPCTPNLYLLLEAPHPKPIPANRDSPNYTSTYYCDIYSHPYLLLGLPPESAPVPRPLSVPVYVGAFPSIPVLVTGIAVCTHYGDPHPYSHLVLGLLHESVPIIGTLINTYRHYGAPHPYLYSWTCAHTHYWDTHPCLYMLLGPLSVPIIMLPTHICTHYRPSH